MKKVSATETTIFVYDAASQLVAEYSTATLPAIPQVSYLTQDHLGSPRVITNENGAVTSRKDFTAFGDEAISQQRVGGPSGNGYDDPNIRQDYTGYQKDTESGLEFAQARYYNPAHGRFTSVDPLPSSATIRNPQSFNRYSNILNSPYKFSDPLGLLPLPSGSGSCGQWCQNSDGGGGGYSGRDASFDWIPRETQADTGGVLSLRERQTRMVAERVREDGQKRADALFGSDGNVPQSTLMSPSESFMARSFGGPGAYFSNPNDGDPVDKTSGIKRPVNNKGNDPENHMYGSATDPDARTAFYIPEGGEYIMSSRDTANQTYALIYFKHLGALDDITVAVFHLVNIRLGPVLPDGRRKLGEMGPGGGGEIAFSTNGKFMNAPSFHYHLEVYKGRWTKLPSKPKPHFNFNGVVSK